MPILQQSKGVTLIEMVVTIVVLSIGLGGIMIGISQSIRSNADPVRLVQAVFIAKAEMRELLSQPFTTVAGLASPQVVVGTTKWPTFFTYLSTYDISYTITASGVTDFADIPDTDIVKVVVSVSYDAHQSPVVLTGYRMKDD